MTATPQQMENRRIWREALLSGEYQQCRATLRREKDGTVGHCCLGVAAEAVPGLLRRTDIVDDEGRALYADSDYGDSTGPEIYDNVLPDEKFTEFFGLHDQAPFFQANDTLRWDFARIATILIPEDPEVTDVLDQLQGYANAH